MDAGERLPVTFRPRRARQVIYPAAALVILAMLGGALVLPDEGVLSYGLADRVAVVGLGLVIALALHRLASVRAHADRDGLTVVNLVQRRRLEWAEIVNVRLGSGDPWVILDVSDGETVAVMAIQASDGEHGREQARRLARLVAEGTRPPGDS